MIFQNVLLRKVNIQIKFHISHVKFNQIIVLIDSNEWSIIHGNSDDCGLLEETKKRSEMKFNQQHKCTR